IDAAGFDSLGPDLPPILKGTRPVTAEQAAADLDVGLHPAVAAQAEEIPGATTLVIDSPVRSGQSIHHPHGDVVILGSVASGSEILAGGSIHVYGTLRGRAFAGATGNDKARIFCRKNEAELLAIDGWYRTAEDMEASAWGRPIQ